MIQESPGQIHCLVVADRRLENGKIDGLLLGESYELTLGRSRAELEADVETILFVDRNDPGKPLPRFLLDRAVNFRQPLGSQLGGPARVERILERVQDVQPRAERLRDPAREQDRPIVGLIEAAMQENVSQALPNR